MQRFVLGLALLFPAFAQAQIAFPAARVVERDGLVRLATGIQAAPLAGDPALAARRFALQHRDALGLRGAELESPRVSRLRTGEVVRFKTSYRGLPVIGAQVAVALDAEGRVRRVASSARPIHGEEVTRAVQGTDALAFVASDLRSLMTEDGKPAGAFRDVFYVRAGIARLAYELHVATLNPLENVYALVDAETGELVSRENRVYFSDDAKVWQTNPGATEGEPLVTQSLTDFLPPTAERDPEGRLAGTLLDALSCCARAECNPQNPINVITGTISMGPFQLPFEAQWCDLRPRASNTLDGRTDYDYSADDPLGIDPPQDPATTGLTIGDDAADRDTFAEVHGFYHANRAYQFFRSLGDPGFLLRDGQQDPPRKTQIWANFLIPDAFTWPPQTTPGGVLFFPLVRIPSGNAAFMPRESWAELPIFTTANLPQTDAIVLFQGTAADSAYDGEVIYHELTHGVVFSTANLSGPHLDQYGALDEAGSLHEGFADYFAGAMTGDPAMAEWFGAMVSEGASLRSLDNDFRCPDLLIGEVHNDSMHFSGATWSLRQQFLGADSGKTFDTAVFDALKTLVPASGFAETVEAIADEVEAAFASTPGARDTVLAEYRARGVIECVKVIEYVEPRAEYWLPGTASGYSPLAPGPLQLKLVVPEGAQSLSIAARLGPSLGIGLGGGQVQVRALVSVGQPVRYAGEPGHLLHDAQIVKTLAVGAGETLSAEVALEAPRGGEVFVSIANAAADGLGLLDLTLAAEALRPETDAGLPDASEPDAALEPDASEPDAGEVEDAGADAGADAGPKPDAGSLPPDAGAGQQDAGSQPPPAPSAEDEGCGCAAGGAAPALYAAACAGLALLRRRRPD
ncbi:MAG: hypothetical protein ACOX6T_23720 [Myxococcales bacterium]|jgi:hypothetical protein